MLEPQGNGKALNVEFEDSFLAAWPMHGSTRQSSAGRMDSRPVLLERYLDRPWIPFELRTQLWFPRSPVQEAALPKTAASVHSKTVNVDENYRYRKSGNGTDMTLAELLTVAAGLGYGTSAKDFAQGLLRKNVAQAIDQLVRELFEDPTNIAPRDGGLDADAIKALTPLVLNELAETQHGMTNMLTALWRVVGDAGLPKEYTSYLRQYLGVFVRGWGQHEYRVKIDAFSITDFEDETTKKSAEGVKKALEEMLKHAKGKGGLLFKKLKKYFPVTWMIGTAVVEYTGNSKWNAPDADAPKESKWRGDFTVIFAGLKMGLSVGDAPKIDFDQTGWQWAGRPAGSDEVAGIATLQQGDLFAGFGSLGQEHGGARLSLLGSGGGRGAVTISFDGKVEEKKFGAGISFSSMFGHFTAGNGFDSRLLPEDEDEAEDFDCYWDNTFGELAVHFPTNGAKLMVPTEKELDEMDRSGRLDIRSALAIFTACELPLLSDAHALIQVVGHADRPDDDRRNVPLSVNRATSVVNYLHSLLGNGLTFGIPVGSDGIPGRLLLLGLGEAEAAIHQPDGQEADPRFRRVDISVSIPLPGKAAPTVDEVRERLAQERGKDADVVLKTSFLSGPDPACS